jgi:hypothetical protein
MHDTAEFDRLARAALEALSSGRADLAHSPLERLAAAAPDHRSVRLLRRWARGAV